MEEGVWEQLYHFWRKKRDIIQSTQDIAELVNSQSNDIIYTSGATESINLAIKGCAYQFTKS